MKKNRIILIIILIIAVLSIVGFFGVNLLKEKQVSSQIEEYTPQEEIAEEQLRKTMVNLYFYNNETGELEKESRMIDAVELLENPYIKLVQMLIEGPKSEKLKTLIPEGTNIIKAEIKEGCAILDMSIDLLNHTEDADLKNKMIYSIVNTLTELTEVDSVKFLINGEPNEEFSEVYVKI